MMTMHAPRAAEAGCMHMAGDRGTAACPSPEDEVGCRLPRLTAAVRCADHMTMTLCVLAPSLSSCTCGAGAGHITGAGAAASARGRAQRAGRHAARAGCGALGCPAMLTMQPYPETYRKLSPHVCWI